MSECMFRRGQCVCDHERLGGVAGSSDAQDNVGLHGQIPVGAFGLLELFPSVSIMYIIDRSDAKRPVYHTSM